MPRLLPLTLAVFCLVPLACRSTRRPSSPRANGAPVVTLSIVGTNDLHGRLAMLPLLGGTIANLRRARSQDGAVVLVDAGDMFQGTLESNLNEGSAVVRGYNALGYSAVTLGNHEFDYGPAGEATFARAPTDDPRGALRARAREARFPFLTANIVESATGERPAWDNAPASVTLTAAGVTVGVVGVSTEATPSTTLAANFRGLAMRPLAERIAAEASRLRARGAAVVIALAHAGGSCRRFDDPSALASCDPDEEIFRVARALPLGAVDVIVAGHTHQGIAHVVNGVAVIESFAMGRAFGRVDLRVERATGRVIDRRVFAPRSICTERGGDEPDPERCTLAPYEGAPVVADVAVARAVAPALDAARALRDRPVGVEVASVVRAHYATESALPNLVADMLREAVPGADFGLMNNGGVRVDLAPGTLTYGRLFAALPFDNRLVTVRLRGASLREVFILNAMGEHGALALSGGRVAVACDGPRPAATVYRSDGRAVGDDETVTVVTNDYLASGMLRRYALTAPTDDEVAAAPVLRDAVERGLRALGASLRGDDPRWHDPAAPRVGIAGRRPLRCREVRGAPTE